MSPCIGFTVNDSIVCESKHNVVVSRGSVSKFCFSSPKDIFESKQVTSSRVVVNIIREEK